MGPENRGAPMVAYIDGHSIEIRGPLPEFTIDDVSENMKTAGKILEEWADIRTTMEVEGIGLRSLFDEAELYIAVHLASCFKSTRVMAHRYLHTKKKRTRKKCEKRIMAWFWEVFR